MPSATMGSFATLTVVDGVSFCKQKEPNHNPSAYTINRPLKNNELPACDVALLYPNRQLGIVDYCLPVVVPRPLFFLLIVRIDGSTGGLPGPLPGTPVANASYFQAILFCKGKQPVHREHWMTRHRRHPPYLEICVEEVRRRL